jgi:hypothetical protein
MPFVSAARDRVKQLKRDDPERVILQFLLNQGVGVDNAKPWPKIAQHLARRGIRMAKNTFQRGILKATRENDIFIGATDRHGYFLINDRGDADKMDEFYERRIKKERANLKNLRRLTNRQWPSSS